MTYWCSIPLCANDATSDDKIWVILLIVGTKTRTLFRFAVSKRDRWPITPFKSPGSVLKADSKA